MRSHSHGMDPFNVPMTTSSSPLNSLLISSPSSSALFRIVDLPGYGYAKLSRSETEKWGAMMEAYLSKRPGLLKVVQLVDIRHEPTQDDLQMNTFLRGMNLPFLVVATKADKLSKAQRGRSIPMICRALAVQPWEVLTYSSEDGTGMDRLLARVEEVLQPEAEPEMPEWAENMPEDDDE